MIDSNDDIVDWITEQLEDGGVLTFKSLDGDENPAGMYRPPGFTVDFWERTKKHHHGWGESLTEAIRDLIG